MVKYVNTVVLNLRNGPGTKYYTLEVLNMDQKVEVIQEDKNWTKVKCLGKIGFVASMYLREEY